MATVFDFDPATLTGLADGDPITGLSAGWTPSTSPAPTYVAVGPGGLPAARFDGSANLQRAATRGDTFTIHVVARRPRTPSTTHTIGWAASGLSTALAQMGADGLLWGQVRSGGATSAFTAASGLGWDDGATHVVSLSASPAGADLYLDGAVVASLPGPLTLDTSATSPATVYASGAGQEDPAVVSRVVATDAVFDPTDVDALLGTYAAAMTATGQWSISGVATLAEVDPFIPVGIPAPTAGGSVTPPAPPEPQAPPAGLPEPVIRRLSEVMPAPELDARGFPIDWSPASVVNEPYGRLQVVVEGVDITYWNGMALPFPRWTRKEPFGPGDATIQVPQITAFHTLPGWCVPGAAVDIRLVRTDGTTRSAFAGVLAHFGHRADSGVFTLECLGVVFADDLQLRQPAFLTAPRDIGHVIADALNDTVSRRHDPIARVSTGCMTSVLGGWEPKVTGYTQQLLATAITHGKQWTVKCEDRTPVIAVKDTTTVSWTVANGARGIQVDLEQDWSQAPNVLYGEGISPDGGRWRNAMYPNWRPDQTPVFPMAPTQSMRVGTTDAQTTTGRGVSDWQAKVGLPVTGRYTQTERARCFQVQKAAGIQQDGTVGPQTWAATFGTGSNTGTLDCFYMPIAFATQVMPRVYGPAGDDLGANPAYDPDVLRVEEKVDFGQGVTKAEGLRAGSELLARSINPGWAGTVSMRLDPQETSRFEVREGSNGVIRHFRGQDLQVHVAQVEYGEQTVTATVDTNARDYPTLAAIRDRERNATDPAKARVKRLNRGSFTEARATFDAESPAGHVPRHALFGDLWTVVRIPMGSYGTVVRTELTTTGSASPFSVAVFDSPITAADLLSIVGNPLTAEANPWSEQADALEARGLLMSWGWAKQPAGYYPMDYTNPDGESFAPVTGRLVDDAAWEFSSTLAPWLWVAEIASAGCFIEGRFWPGAD